MPTNRRPLARQRHPSFTPEVLTLFLELERVPRRRQDDDYRRKSKDLARLLDLTGEWWTGEHVNSRATQPSKPPEFAAYDAFFRVAAVRKLLLAAIKVQGTDAPQAEERPMAATGSVDAPKAAQ